MLLGLFIYLFYRPDSTIVNHLFSLVFTQQQWQDFSLFFANKIPISALGIYSLPAGLWVLSATIITFGKSINIGRKSIDLSWIPLCYALGLELFQALHITDGTFDIKDIIVTLVFWLTGMIYLRQIPEQIKSISISPTIIIASYLILFLADTAI